MPASSLPLAAPVAVSAAARLAYVMRHFHLVYPSAPVITVGYADSQPQVTLAEASGNFFAENNPYPVAPNWREWLGQRIPFFFDNAPAQPLLSYVEGKTFISADIISAAFYLLSGWQEYFSTERDQHGRFPYAASVQKQYSFVTLPVINYYFDVLKTAVEYVSGRPLRPRRWGPNQANFAAFVSHDIDNLRSAWKAPAKAALQQRQFSLFGKLLWQHFTQPDAWDNLEDVAAATAQYGARSTFFILPTHGKAPDGTPNADYCYSIQLLRRLHKLSEAGCEINLHGSIGTALDEWKLDYENRLLERVGLGGGLRFHYLRWDARQTFAVLSESDFVFDSTLGFAEHFGFRHSFCLPFYPFDFTSERATDFLEIPLNVMDATLHHPHYLQLTPAEILPALIPVFAEIKRFGGVASVLWHNENFDPNNTQNGPQQFHEIMRHLQQQGAAFLTGREIWQEYTAEPAILIHNL
jgi:peptidoglycan/xylan/chitin deacetylase (PgdA/CDA1 family)